MAVTMDKRVDLPCPHHEYYRLASDCRRFRGELAPTAALRRTSLTRYPPRRIELFASYAGQVDLFAVPQRVLLARPADFASFVPETQT